MRCGKEEAQVGLGGLTYNKQLQRAVIRRRGDTASAPFHYALAVRFIRRRAAAELRRWASLTRSSRIRIMKNEYTAVVQKDGRWWVGWLEEIPGVNSQGQTREELMENLRSALDEALAMNRSDARQAASDDFEEVRIQQA